jgi:hypothetical protein
MAAVGTDATGVSDDIARKAASAHRLHWANQVEQRGRRLVDGDIFAMNYNLDLAGCNCRCKGAVSAGAVAARQGKAGGNYNRSFLVMIRA